MAYFKTPRAEQRSRDLLLRSTAYSDTWPRERLTAVRLQELEKQLPTFWWFPLNESSETASTDILSSHTKVDRCGQVSTHCNKQVNMSVTVSYILIVQ